MKKTVVLIIACLCAMEMLMAQDRYVSVGGYFSPKACGISLTSYRPGSFSDIRLTADLEKVLLGQTAMPGIRADWHLNFILLQRAINQGLTANFYAGAGAMLGYVEDGKSGRGVTAALSGNIGVLFHFAGPLSVSVGFSGNVGAHITWSDKSGSTMNWYRSGLKNILMPEVGIRYRY